MKKHSVSHDKRKEGSHRKRTDQSTSASANAAESVALPLVVGSPNHRATSMTLSSMSMNASATPVLVSGTTGEGQVSDTFHFYKELGLKTLFFRT